jgi:hypothetical protein
MRWVLGFACSASTLRRIGRPWTIEDPVSGSGDAADLADRLRLLIANPAVREAVRQTAERSIHEHYQGSKSGVEDSRAGRPV